MSMNVFNAAGTVASWSATFCLRPRQDAGGCCQPPSSARWSPRWLVGFTAGRSRRLQPCHPRVHRHFVKFPGYRELHDLSLPCGLCHARLTLPLRPSPLRPRRVLPLSAPTTRSCVPELGVSSANKLDGIGDRLMFRLAYRNFGDHESLVGNFTVNSGGVAGIRWFELRDVTHGSRYRLPGKHLPARHDLALDGQCGDGLPGQPRDRF